MPRSKLARTLWPGLGKAELAVLDRVDANELLRQYRLHFNPPPYVGDYSAVERAESARRFAEWTRSDPEAARRSERAALISLGLFLLLLFGVLIISGFGH